MKNNARRKHIGYKYDRFGRIIDGFIDNGRVLMMIALCLSVSFMVSELSNLKQPDQVQAPEPEKSLLTDEFEPVAPAAEEAVARHQKRSDYLVKQHLKCADPDFRSRNRSRCDALLKDVDDAVDDETKNALRNKTWSPDEGTNRETESQLTKRHVEHRLPA